MRTRTYTYMYSNDSLHLFQSCDACLPLLGTATGLVVTHMQERLKSRATQNYPVERTRFSSSFTSMSSGALSMGSPLLNELVLVAACSGERGVTGRRARRE